MKAFLKSTATWGMICCLLISISSALPWGHSPVFDISMRKPTFMIPLSAYADWHGAAISIAGGIGLLFLVATGSLKPIPWWRTLGIAVVGIASITFTLIMARRWNHFPVQESGGLLAIVSATGLLLVACLEVRQLLERKSKARPDAPNT